MMGWTRHDGLQTGSLISPILPRKELHVFILRTKACCDFNTVYWVAAKSSCLGLGLGLEGQVLGLGLESQVLVNISDLFCSTVCKIFCKNMMLQAVAIPKRSRWDCCLEWNSDVSRITVSRQRSELFKTETRPSYSRPKTDFPTVNKKSTFCQKVLNLQYQE